ncbi:VENN motif pre-toxin domain-containing protein, partial [Moraxella catarrhalis]
MWGDYQVDEPNTLTQAQKDKLINQAKLIAGITAAFAGEDVNVAAGVAAEAVRWNAVNKELVGTVKDFENLLNNSIRKVGLFQGNEAHLYLLSLNETNWMLEPTQTGYFNNKASRYIYTKKGGWIDMVHFLFYASEAYSYKKEMMENPSTSYLGLTQQEIVS